MKKTFLMGNNKAFVLIFLQELTFTYCIQSSTSSVFLFIKNKSQKIKLNDGKIETIRYLNSMKREWLKLFIQNVIRKASYFIQIDILNSFQKKKNYQTKIYQKKIQLVYNCQSSVS